jgi:hypothetical protein
VGEQGGGLVKIKANKNFKNRSWITIVIVSDIQKKPRKMKGKKLPDGQVARHPRSSAKPLLYAKLCTQIGVQALLL